MKKLAVINVVGLSVSVIGEHTPFLKEYIKSHFLSSVKPMLPALTTSVQSTYLTGKTPGEHGIIGNGWFDKIDAEIKFWKQSNKLVMADKIWDNAKRRNASFTCANICWWYNMYSNVDYSVTPRPNYLADGRKIPDCYTKPSALRDTLQSRLGMFPLFQFWGPGANIKSSEWIANAAILTDIIHQPTLSLVYLPHLDYCLQKHGPDINKISGDLHQIDKVIKKLVDYFEDNDTDVIILSEYGISPVSQPIHINRILRAHQLLSIRIERGLEVLDPGASIAFGLADHQIAHIYVNDPSSYSTVRKVLESIEGVSFVLDKDQQKKHSLSNERCGDFVLVAKDGYWFSYYFWLDDKLAPDYARCVDIYKKPGYDPVEMFMTSKLRVARRLLQKKLGMRYVMDVIPLDATLIKGSHGAYPAHSKYYPVLISSNQNLPKTLLPTDVYNIIWQALFFEDSENIEFLTNLATTT